MSLDEDETNASRLGSLRRDVLARALTHALVGLEPRRVDVEAHVRDGIPGFAIVGLADRASQEARDASGALLEALFEPIPVGR